MAGAILAVGGFFALCMRHARTLAGYLVSLARMPLAVTRTETEVVALRKRVDDGQQITDGKFRILFADIQKPVWKSDGEGNCLWCNPYMLATLGRKMEELLGARWRSVIYDDDRERVTKEWDSCIKEGRTFEMRYRWKHADGSPIPIVATGSIIRDSAQTRILSIVGIVTVLKENN